MCPSAESLPQKNGDASERMLQLGLSPAFGARCAHGPCQDAGVHVGGTRVIDNEVLDVRSDERGIAGKQSKAATAP